MREREGEGQTIIGFTEAELGFFLALVVFLLWVLDRPAPSGAGPPVGADSVRALITELAAGKEAERELERLRDSLRSTLLPYCETVGRASGALAEIKAVPGAKLVVDGDTVDYAGLALATERERRAVRGVCRHFVWISVDPALSAPESERLRAFVSTLGLRTRQGP